MTANLSQRVAAELGAVKYTLFDDFEFEGYWWLPGDMENQAPGVLKVEGSKAQLSLSLQDWLWSSRKGQTEFTNGEGRRIAEQAAVLHGISALGLPFSIIGADLTSANMTFPGYNHSRFYARRVVIGAHIEADNFEASSLRFLYSDLLESALPEEKQKENKTEPSEEILQSVDMGGYAINLLFVRTVSNERSKLTVNKEVWVEIKARKPMVIQELLRLASMFGNYLEMVHGVPCSPLRAQISSPTGELLPLYFSIEKEWGKRRKKDGLLLRLSELNPNQFQNSVKNWYDSSEGLQSVVFLFASLLSYPALHTEINFVMWCQALEAFHRATRTKVYMQQEEYDVLLKKLLELIPEGLESSFEGKLKANIEHGNQLSQRDMLSDLLNSLPADTKESFVGDWDMVREIVNTRNYYTHFTDKLRAKKLSPTKIAGANIALGALLNGLLLVHLGLGEELVWKRTTTRSTFKDYQYIRGGCIDDFDD